MSHDISFVFFGTTDFSVIISNELKKAGLIPSLIVTAPDKPAGRGMKLTPPPAKVFGEKNNIPILQPNTLTDFRFQISDFRFDLFVVASYGKIIPKEILDTPEHGSLNVHPSLLPLYRGPSPIYSQILENTRIVGVTIMLMDEKMDHGPILAQQVLEFSIFNFQFSKLHDELAHLGGKLLAETIPKWIAGEIEPKEQDHARATYTKKITKEDGFIDLDDDPELNYRKFLAYSSWPGIRTVLFAGGKKDGPSQTVKITDAALETKDGPSLAFVIKKVIPEGKKETSYEQFIKSSNGSQMSR